MKESGWQRATSAPKCTGCEDVWLLCADQGEKERDGVETVVRPVPGVEGVVNKLRVT